MPRRNIIWLILLCGGLFGRSVARARDGGAIDTGLARRYFAEVKALSDRDGGALWGRALYGPMLFADHANRSIVADRADQDGRLTPHDDVFVGTLPPEYSIANTAFDFAGVKWTMVIWPPPTDRNARGLLLMHELWHRIQDDLGFPSTGPANAHLDTPDGRIWLRFELAALRKALTSNGETRRHAIEDALVFRTRRRSVVAGSAEEERALEMHEGLANYTGAVLAGGDKPGQIAGAVRELDAGEKKKTYVRSFAYATGPAYGLLLDDLALNWRKGLTPKDDLGELIGAAIDYEAPENVEADAVKRSLNYDDGRISREETERESRRQEMLALIRAKLVDGPILRLPFIGMKIQFDPNGVIPLGEAGTVYPTARIVDAWGVLTVSDGVLIDKTWQSATVAAPEDSVEKPRSGPGWTLEFADDWSVRQGQRKGDYVLQRNR